MTDKLHEIRTNCFEKQAKYIHALSLATAKKYTPNRPEHIIPIERARRYSIKEARLKIKELREIFGDGKIKKFKDESYTQRYSLPVYFENYVKVKHIKVDARDSDYFKGRKKKFKPDDIVMEITAEDGRKIDIKKKYFTRTHQADAFKLIKVIMDEDRKISIGYKKRRKKPEEKTILILPEDPEEEKVKKRELVETMRLILKHTDGILPIKRSRTMQAYDKALYGETNFETLEIKEDTVITEDVVQATSDQGKALRYILVSFQPNIRVYDKIQKMVRKYSLEDIRSVANLAHYSMKGYFYEEEVEAIK